MFAGPNLRTVVLEKQRTLCAQRGDYTRPTKPRIALVDKVRLRALDERYRATREDEVVVNVEKRTCAAAGLRWNDREPIFFMVETGDQIVADDLHFNSEGFKRLDHSFDVARSTTRLCARSRRRSKINNSRARAMGYRSRAFTFENFLFELYQFTARLGNVVCTRQSFAAESYRRS